MPRIMSIDYGDKRIGIAITDPLGMFAKPYTTIENRGEAYIFAEINKIVAEQKITKIIVGLPISTQNADTAKTLVVRTFFQSLSANIPVELQLWDERYTTCDATDYLKERGINWREGRKVIDQIAAAMILKSYLGQNG